MPSLMPNETLANQPATWHYAPSGQLMQCGGVEGVTDGACTQCLAGLSEMFTLDGPIMGELGGTVTHIAPEIVTHKRVTKVCSQPSNTTHAGGWSLLARATWHMHWLRVQ